MSLANVLLYAALLVLMVYRRAPGPAHRHHQAAFPTARHHHHRRFRGLLPRQARHHRHRRRRRRLRVVAAPRGSAGHAEQAQPTGRHPLGAVGGGLGRHLRRQHRGQAGLGRGRRSSRRVGFGRHGIAACSPWASCWPGRLPWCGHGSRLALCPAPTVMGRPLAPRGHARPAALGRGPVALRAVLMVPRPGCRVDR